MQIQDAVALYRQGRFDEAEAACQAVLARTPKNFDALHLRGVIALHNKSFAEAADFIGQALTISDGNATAHNNFGMALMGLGRTAAALESFDRAIALKPSFAAAFGNRGSALRADGRTAEALVAYDTAIAERPDYAEAWHSRGLVLRDLAHLQDAQDSFTKAIALRPDYAEAHDALGLTLQDLGHVNAALLQHDKAVALKPELADAWNNRGNALDILGRSDEALASYDHALALDPKLAGAWSNRGVLLNNLGRRGEARASFERAIACDPNSADGNWNLGLFDLQEGDFARGWQRHEWRWKVASLKLMDRGFGRPAWLSHEDIVGKTILLHADQGFGDAIQFSRYATLVAARGARVILEVRQPLVTLLASLPGVAQVVAFRDPLPAFDLHCALASLPLAFGTEVSTIPAPEGYLRADTAEVARWRAALGEARGQRVGLAWSGNPQHANDARRSVGLANLLSALPEGFDYVALQKDMDAADRALAASRGIADFSGELGDFRDTAALCGALDVVISVDTSIAHLAGALGKEVWVLLPYNPDWRWMLERRDSPWYASARLYRQSAPDDWSNVVAEVRTDLLKRAATP